MTDKSYTQKAIEVARAIPCNARRVFLWVFPEADLAAYQAMPDTPRLKDYGDYLSRLAGLQADQERRGSIVVRVRFCVEAMLAELERHGWPNDAVHRSRVTAEIAARREAIQRAK